ncbi:MAG TPA: glycosyl hydrolase, partial [Bryobacteraceae bacterium]
RLLADETKLGAELHKALPADVATAPEIGFLHRKLDFGDVYFLANTSNHPVQASATFRTTAGLGAAWWDPMTGEVAKAAGAHVNLALAPYESRVLVFSKDKVEDHAARTATAPLSIALHTGWQVRFGDPSENRPLDRLHSWSDDDATKYYSGTATYQTTVTVPDWKGRQVYLNFGEGTPVTIEERRSGNGMRAMLEGPVREAAVVYVNGKRAGSVWCAPYEVNVTGLVQAGRNTLRIVVANTATNLLAKGPLPDYKALTAKYGERFQAQDMNNLQPLPSGLLGPVRLIGR